MNGMLLEFQRLNGATWLYLSFLLTVAVYFRFNRPFSLRNLDLLLLFWLGPGLLATILVDRELLTIARDVQATGHFDGDRHRLNLLHQGYYWLFIGTLLLLGRCLIDLTLTRRPRVEPNLNVGGLAFLGACLLAFLMYEVMIKEPDPAGRASARMAWKLWKGQESPPTLEVKPPTAVLTTPVLAAHSVVQRMEPMTPQEQSDLERGVARSTVILCHQFILAALILVGWRQFDSVVTGVGMATLYLLLPITAFNVEKIDHILPSAFLAWAVVFHRRPAISGLLFGMAGLFYYPLFLIPLWAGYYWRRGTLRFLGSFLAAGVVMWLLFYWVNPLRTFVEMWHSSIAWKAWNFRQAPETLGFWTESTQFYRLPVFILFIAGALAVGWPTRKNLAELLALSTALVLGVQLWYADRGGTYIHWYLPLLLMTLFRPNLRLNRPPELRGTTFFSDD